GGGGRGGGWGWGAGAGGGPRAGGGGGGVGAVADAQVAVDRSQVCLDGVGGEPERLADADRAGVHLERAQDLDLARGERGQRLLAADRAAGLGDRDRARPQRLHLRVVGGQAVEGEPRPEPERAAVARAL